MKKGRIGLNDTINTNLKGVRQEMLHSATNQTENINGYRCSLCGDCCYQDIPVTLFDIHRIAENLMESHETVFKKYAEPRITARSNVFAVKRKNDGSCVFLGSDNKCTIYDFRPRICGFFPCPSIAKEDKERWKKLYLKSASFELFWEHSVADNFTRKYIYEYGTEWDANGYNNALIDIQRCIITNLHEKLAVAAAPNNAPMAMIYDCSKCAKHVCRAQAYITLMDIQRIARYLGKSVKKAFSEIISEAPVMSDRCFKMRKINDVCIFRFGDGKCSIYEVRPKYCEFTPCHQKVTEQDTWRRFFFASGAMEDQWKHNAAVMVTNQYVKEHGVEYCETALNKSFQRIEFLLNNRKRREDFYRQIKVYRYDVSPIEPAL